MPRSVIAYLADILDACDAIQEVLAGVDLDAYQDVRHPLSRGAGVHPHR